MQALTRVLLATIIVTACQDAATAPLAPSSPSLKVDNDGTWLVNSLADPGDGICTNSECTLREAIAAAQQGDNITFKGNLSGTIATQSELMLTQSLTITGPGARVLTIDGQGAHRVFQITGTSSVAIVGLTILGGSAVDGGGIYVGEGSQLGLVASVVAGNVAASGGGIFNAGTLTILRSTVGGNRSTLKGGGIQSEGPSLTISRSTVSGNRTEGIGGGIYVCSADCSGKTLTLRSSTITRNEAEFLAGGLFLSEFSATGIAFNTIIAGNRSPQSDLSVECIALPLVSLGYNLTTGQECETLTAPTDIRVDPAQVFSAVLFGVLADNGGQIPTHALLERGFAVDAGYCPGETIDQRGFPRPFDDLRMPNALDGCDIGAYEWQPPAKKGKP